jgi:hypothetical protein
MVILMSHYIIAGPLAKSGSLEISVVDPFYGKVWRTQNLCCLTSVL